MSDVLKLLDQTVRYIHATGFTDSAHVRYDGRGINDEARYVSIPFEECPDPVCSEARTLLAAPSPALTREALQPFAAFADPRRVVPADFVITQGSSLAKRQLTMGDCYAAADALSALGTPPLVGSSDYTLADFEAQFERTPPPAGCGPGCIRGYHVSEVPPPSSTRDSET